MRLLVSVRSPTEAARAVEGGADIVDAKEPARGSLGAVEGEVLRTIAGALPALPHSVWPSGIWRSRQRWTRRPGLFGEHASDGLPQGWVRGSRRRDQGGKYHCAARGDGSGSAWPPSRGGGGLRGPPRGGKPRAVHGLRPRRGGRCHGLLLDTWTKDGRDLFAWMSPSLLKEWVTRAARARMVAGVAGSIGQTASRQCRLPDPTSWEYVGPHARGGDRARL